MRIILKKALGMVVCAGVALGSFSCLGNASLDAGSGRADEMFTLSGAATFPNGMPIGQAKVHIRPSGYSLDAAAGAAIKPAGRDTVTDSAGHFRIEGLPIREYAVEILQGDTLGLFRRVFPTSDAELKVEGSLAPMGRVKGFLVLPDSAPAFYVQAYGLGRRIRVSPGGGFTLGLASGEYVLRLSCESAIYSSLDIPDIRIVAGQDTLLPEINSADFLKRKP